MALLRSVTRSAIIPWTVVGVLLFAVILIVHDTGSAQKQAKAPGKVREFLTPYVGYDTKIGKIKRVAEEFVVIQDENTQTVVPFTAIQSVRLVKENEAEPVKLDIRLVAKD